MGDGILYGKVNKPFWSDKPVVVIGGGPSLIGFDYEQLRGAHVLAVKGKIFGIPWADAVFGLDVKRYTEWREKLAETRTRVYWAVPEEQLDQAGPPPAKNITLLKRMDGRGLSDDPSEIYGGGTSGFGALQVCIHKQARAIVLLGFDYNGGCEQQSEKWDEWAEHFAVYAPYFNEHRISVVNACPASTIRCFQKMTLPDAVAMVRHSIGA
jgi:hypothetical protein